MAACLISALVLGGSAAQAVPAFEPYQGLDQARIPQALRRFFVAHGLTVKIIEVRSGYFSYQLESARFKTPWPEWNGGQGTDYVFVTLDMYGTAAEADAEFARLKASVDGTCAYFSKEMNARCENVSFGAGGYGMAYIFGEARRPLGPPHVQDLYAIRVPGPDNAVIRVEGRNFSSWTSSDVPSKAIAAELAKAGRPVASEPSPASPQRSAPPAPALRPTMGGAEVQAVSDARWAQLPTLEEAERTVTGRNDFLVFRGADGRYSCLPKTANLPGAASRPSGGRFRLLQARELMLAALRAMGLSQADIASVVAGVDPPNAGVPAAVRRRAYMLWRPGRVSHYLYGAQLVLSPAAASGVARADWEPPQLPCAVASSEHSSVRGTINGGGDFIRFEPMPAGARALPLLTRAAWSAPSPGAAAGPGETVELPGALVSLDADATAAIDLAPNGVVAVALLAGAGEVAEQESGARRRLAAGQFALSVPRLGVSPTIQLPPDSREALEAVAGAPAARAAPSPAPAAGVITDVTAARQVAWGAPVGAAEVFTPDVNPIYVWFRHRGVGSGSRIEAVWFYLETAQPREIGRGQVTVTPPADWGQFSFELEKGRAWPAGRYRVALSIDGRPAGEARFRIAEAPEARVAPEVYRDDALGYELAIPPGWTRTSGPQGFGLVNQAAQLEFQAAVQHNDDPVPVEQLFAAVVGAFRNDPDYELLQAAPRQVLPAGRDGYLLVLRSKADGHALVVIVAPRDPGGASRDFYLLKTRSARQDSQAARDALEQLLAGFRIVH